MRRDYGELIPMAPATLHILLALAREQLHGYGIMQEVLRQSEGRYRLGPGTLYDNLQRLLQQKLVEERGKSEESRRRYYQLTRSGRAALKTEIERLDGVVREGQLHFGAARLRRG